MSKSAAFGIAIPCEIRSKGTDLKWTWACGNSSHTWPTSTINLFHVQNFQIRYEQPSF